MQRANKENWKALRDAAESKSIAKAQQKTADAVANNAVKLERAKSLAIDRIINALSNMPDNAGSHIRQQGENKKGQYITVDFDLQALVSSLEKLMRNGNTTADNIMLTRAQEILGGVKSAID